jgi:hypothetical protein
MSQDKGAEKISLNVFYLMAGSLRIIVRSIPRSGFNLGSTTREHAE